MAEDKNDQPDEREPAVPDELQYREVSKEDLERVLAEQEKWAETGGQDGSPADLRRDNLEGADLRGANLEGAFLGGANFSGAKLFDANLHKADLGGANLQVADLRSANLQGAVLSGANLSGANLLTARYLTQEQLDQACGNEWTKLSDGLKIGQC